MGSDTARQPGGQAGDRRIGVVWHAQGSGKSLTMAFYAGRSVGPTTKMASRSHLCPAYAG